MSFYMLKRQGNYYFRIRVPQDLQQHFTYHEIKRSLRTKNPKQARSQVRLWSSKAEIVFMTLRANVLAPEQVQDFIRRELPSVWRKVDSGPLASSIRKQHQDPQKKVKLLAQVVEAYIKEHVTLGKWTEKTTGEFRAQLIMFLRVVGNVPLKSIDRQVMVSYLEMLKRLPPGISTKAVYKGKSLDEILAIPDLQPMC